MNNTRTLAIVAVLMAATLVVGTFATVATTQSAFAYANWARSCALIRERADKVGA
jgi:hypothetical protein